MKNHFLLDGDHFKLFIFLVSINFIAFPLHGQNLEKVGSQWTPLEFSLKNASYEGNPFNLIARVTFTHGQTGRKKSTQMFYDGKNTWKFRFTGTMPGK